MQYVCMIKMKQLESPPLLLHQAMIELKRIEGTADRSDVKVNPHISFWLRQWNREKQSSCKAWQVFIITMNEKEEEGAVCQLKWNVP